MLGASPDEAARLIHDLVFLVLFVAVVGLAMSVVLSIHVARSVAEPLREVERAMDGVARRRPRPARAGRQHRRDRRGGRGLQPHGPGPPRAGADQGDLRPYVTREIRDEILAGRVARGEGQLLEVTILFADLRDFTPWVEATEPREVVRDLNEYFTEMDAAIRAHGGLVLQFIGDEIEAVFGAPVAHARPRRPGGARRARDAPAPPAWNERRRAAGQPLAPQRHRHPHRHRAGRQHRRRRSGSPTRWSATRSTSPRASRASTRTSAPTSS